MIARGAIKPAVPAKNLIFLFSLSPPFYRRKNKKRQVSAARRVALIDAVLFIRLNGRIFI